MNEDLELRLAKLSPAKRALLKARMTRGEGQSQRGNHISRRAEDSVSDLSFAQERIWLHQQIQPSSIAYNRPTNIRLRGPLDVAVLRLAMLRLLERHESLSSVVDYVDGKPCLVVRMVKHLEMPLLDLRGEAVPEDRAQAVAQEELLRPFDLGKGPLLRTRLLRLGEEEHLLLLTIHHFTFDAWSEPVLLEELSSNYGALWRGDTAPKNALSIQCADFAAWDRSVERGTGLEPGRAYWRAELADPPVLQLGTDYPRQLEQSEHAGDVEFELPDELLSRLREVAKREEATLFSLLLSAFFTLLHRYTDEEDIIVGCPVAGRTREELEPLIGVFINMLPLRAKLGAWDGFRSLLGRVQESVLHGLEHQEVPLQFIVDDVLIDRDLGGSPLYQAIFVHERIPLESREVNSVVFESEEAPSPGTMVDLTMEISETENRVLGRLKYRKELWDEPTIERMVGHFLTLLEGIVEEPGKGISELPMLTAEERHQLLVEWNDTAVAHPEKCVHEMFEEQVEKSPDAVAVVFEDKRLTYRELNERANQLAHCLIDKGVGPEILVGLCVERSLEMMIGLMGILKAGGAYVPLDPDFPQQRLKFIIEDAQADLLITQRGLESTLPGFHGQVIYLDELKWTPNFQENPPNVVAPTSRSYVIYTSGSTGRPKGVQIEHHSLANFLESMAREPGLDATDILLAVTTVSFDIAVLELFLPLTRGARVVIAGRDLAIDGKQLRQLMDTCGATVMQATPATWKLLLESGWSGRKEMKILCGGEAISQDLALALMVRCESLWNLYGPTETTIWSTAAKVSSKEGSITIGQPIANTQIYILDKHQEPVPVGISGKLHIGGSGLARGYLRRPELTTEKFVANPFDDNPNSRIYDTGDLCRWRADGNLEFLGRMDDQVKLRGFRIEPGEIESAINAHSGVSQSVVLLREDRPGDKRLVAYMVSTPGVEVDTRGVREHVQRKLPDYMVPSMFVELEKLPLTPSGKVDKRALPAPDASRPELDSGYVAPRTMVEEELSEIWQELLGVDRVGIHDNFFELGGHSLVAIRVNARIASELQVDLSVRSLFEAPTIAGLADKIEELRHGGARKSSLTLIRVARDPGCGLPLSFSQQRLWFLEQLEGDLTAYNMSFGWRIRGDLDAEALRRALEMLVNRHEVLRTTFEMLDGEPVQIIGKAARFDLPVVDLAPLKSKEQDLEISRFGRQEAGRAFDLSKDLMLRAFLLRLSENEYVLQLMMHHIASDGWSLGVLRRELGKLYNANCLGEEADLSPQAVQYADFAIWQRQGLSDGGRLEELLTYWSGQLSGLEALELPTDRTRPLVPSYRGARHEFELPEELVEQLKELGRIEGTTLQMTLLAAFQVLLSRYSGQEDIAVGTPIAGRNHADLEEQIGFFVNTLVLRTDLSGEPTFRELLGRVREMSLGAYDHEDLPFEKLVEELQPERDPSRSPLTQVMFQLLNFADDDLQFEDLEVIRLPSRHERVRFDLEMHLRQRPEKLSGEIVYSTDLFDASRIECMVGHFLTLLEGVAADPEKCIGELSMLTEAERHQLLVEWNDTAVEYPAKCVHELFEEQVEMTPDATAIVCGGEELNYRDLNERANQLAHYLRDLGVGPDVLVAIHVDQSLNQVVAVLGVLKAGGAYSPLSSSYPKERLRLMLEDADVKVIIYAQALETELPEHQARRICLEVDWPDISRRSRVNPIDGACFEHLVYVLYTSGSTGRPKGVAFLHRGGANLIHWQISKSSLKRGHRTLLFSPLIFDASFTDIFVTLCSGGGLVMTPPDVRLDPGSLAELIRVEAVELINLPFVALQSLASHNVSRGEPLELPDLREVISTAEQLQITPAVRDWLRGNPNAALQNQYGPTETHVVTALNLEGRADSWPLVPSIGKPIANTRIYILNQNMEPVPIGVSGSLYIAGDSLARGYLNRPELTKEKFVSDPFDETPDSRLYSTGDSCRWRMTGDIEFLGRKDDQVKLRGFRIEIGEIESVFNDHPKVAQCVVVLREGHPGEEHLVAYCVSKAEGATNVASLREHVSERLPSYMVPSVFVMLDTLPLTPSGKVDRRSLPEPDRSRQELGIGYVSPRTPLEDELATIWCDLLGVDRCGIHDDFFELGGHSLVAIRVNARIASELQVDLQVRSLFEAPTIAGLADKIEELRHGGARKSSLTLIRVARDPGCGLPLSFSQQRLWFLEQLEGDLTAYNMSFGWRIRGDLDAEALRRALEMLVNRHEVLRTTFEMLDGEPVQIIGKAARFDLPVVDLAPLKSKEQDLEISRFGRQEAGRAFDLSKDLMLRAFLLRLSENESVLLLMMHHIASDGWSLGVLRRELGKLYNANCLGEEADLSPQAVQYADFAIWQRQGLSDGGRLEELLTYWSGQLSGLEALELPTDRTRPLVPSYRGARHEFELPEELVEQLKELGRIEGTTLQMTLLAAFQVLLSRYSGQEDIAVGTPIAGRNHADLEEQIGFFVNTLVLRTDLSGEPTFRELLGRVREMSLGAYDHEDLPFEKLVEELQPERDPSRSPLTQVMFQLLNFGDGKLALSDLEVSQLPSRSERVRFDLEMHVWQRTEKLSGVIVYSKDLFDASRIERMVGHFLTLLEGIAADPEKCIGELPILTERERHQLLVEWNDTAVDYPDKCVHQLFGEQVEKSPDAIAVVFEDKQLTYRELNERANRLAHCLISLGVGPDVLVAICVERSLEMIVGLLGILKAGGAYVPLDPDYPEARLAFMLEDCGKPLLVTTEGLSKRFVGLAGDLLFLDDASVLTGQPVENPGISIDSENLAYVIYTSGSTGRPKGVEIPHRGVVRLVCDVGYCHFDSDRVLLQFAPLSFDAATFEIWGTLLNGARLVVAQSGRDTMDRIPELIARHGITTAWLTAGLFNQLVDKDPGVLSGLEELLIGGEALSPQHVSKAIAGLPGTRIINGYGPTENTTFTTTFQIEQREDHSAISIGRPITNTQVYILDDALHPLPIGVSGELHIGGDGLARGYLNRPELTADQFVEIEILGRRERVYRTGDLCRWRSDGNLEFLGRIDHQVKIRGFRIELGEIEAVLGACSGIKESVVMAREDTPGDKRLVAYFVLDQNDAVTTAALRRALAEKLPDYMIPAAFVPLDALPLTPNGKVDKRALPIPAGVRPELDFGYVAPRTSVEETLSEVWRELLGVDQVGIHDDFFELGGHSLLVARLVGLVNEKLDRNLMIGEVYRSPTIAGMADLLKRSEGQDASGTNADVGRFLTVLQKGSGGGCVVFIGGLLKERLKELPTSLMILHLAIDGLGRSSFLGLDVRDSVTAYADELETLTLNEPIVIVGHSYGGLLAYALSHTLRERSARNFELILLEPTWYGSDSARHRMLSKKLKLAIGKGPRSLMSSLMKSVVFRVKHRLRVAKIREEHAEIGRMLETGEPVSDLQLFKYYDKDLMLHARGYRSPSPLHGRVHLVFGEKWGTSHGPFLIKEYLKCSPVVLNLGNVDHIELMMKESAAMRWVKLICDLVDPSGEADDQGFTSPS